MVDSVARAEAVSRGRISTEAALVGFGQLLGAIGAVVGVRILTHAMSPASYGELALAMTAVTLLQQTLILPLNSAALRFLVPSQVAGEVSNYVHALRWLAARSSALIFVLGMAICAALLAQSARERLGLLFLVGTSTVFAIVLGIGMVIDGVQNASRRRLVTAWHDTLSSWARFLLAALLIRLSGTSSSAVAMTGYALSAVLTLASQTLLFPPKLGIITKGSPLLQREWQIRMLRFAAPLSLFGLFYSLQLASERWSIKLYGSLAQVGQYAVLVQIGYYPVVTVSNFLVQLVTPLVYARAGGGDDPALLAEARSLVLRLLALVAGMTIVFAALAWLLHGIIFRLLVAPEYGAVGSLLPIVVGGAGVLACGQVAALMLLSEQRTRELVLPKMISSGAAGAGAFVAAKYYGVPGVIAAGIAPAALYCLWLVIISRRKPAVDGSA